jgi:hypothetical protein
MPGRSITRGRPWVWDAKYRPENRAPAELPLPLEGEGESRVAYYRLSPDVKYAMPRGAVVRAKYKEGKLVFAGKAIDVGSLSMLIPLAAGSGSLNSWVAGTCKFRAGST